MILPIVRETRVFSIPPHQIMEALKNNVRKGKRMSHPEASEPFMGTVGQREFNITRILNRPENFMPLVQGRIEDAGEGSIIFIKYTLQFSSRMFVAFWSVTTFFFAIFLWFLQSEPLLGLVSMAAMILNILITHVNFRRQLNITRKLLYQILETQ